MRDVRSRDRDNCPRIDKNRSELLVRHDESKSQNCTAANDMRGCNALFDHLVGAQQERLRDLQAKRLGGGAARESPGLEPCARSANN
jgi:hypothetical protein